MIKKSFLKLVNVFNRNTGFILLLLIVFFSILIITGQGKNRRALEQVQTSAENSVEIIKKQDETLKAIQKLAKDNNILAEQKANTIICMLQVPVAERTPDTENQCRKKAITTSQSSTDSSSTTIKKQQTTTPKQKTSGQPQNKPQDKPSNPPQQTPDNDGVIIDLPILPKVHIPSPL